MLDQMTGFFLSFLANPSVPGIGVAVAFGTVWLLPYWPPLFARPGLWIVMAVSAALTWLAISFIQLPLQSLAGQALIGLLGTGNMVRLVLVAGFPVVLISGLVQEGAKLVPVVIYWWRSGRDIPPWLGLAIGAVAGAGFGIFEAQWTLNTVFAAGWTWQSVASGGPLALAPFWERFFAIGFHVAVSALAGYGLAVGMGWQYYLVASLLHGILNYGAVLAQGRILGIVEVEIVIAVMALAISGVALWLRWRKYEEPGEGTGQV